MSKKESRKKRKIRKQKEAKQAKIARDKATRQIQYYSQIIPHEDIDTPEKLAEWLDDDER